MSGRATSVTVRVSSADFRPGRTGDMGSCAVALAMKRRGFSRPLVGAAVLSWEAGTGKRVYVDTPAAIRNRISSFDMATGAYYGPTTPCSFVVDVSKVKREFEVGGGA